MNNTILLATISMACAGLASFSNKIATENQILFPTYLLMTSIPYFGLILILQNTAKEPMIFTRLSVTLGIIGGALGCIAFYTAYTALSKGGEGSIIFPITSLQVVIVLDLQGATHTNKTLRLRFFSYCIDITNSLTPPTALFGNTTTSYP